MVVTLANYLPAEDWTRAVLTAQMLEAREAERVRAIEDRERAWRARPRPVEPQQERLPWPDLEAAQ